MQEACAAARTYYRAGEMQAAFSLLERAHVRGQSQIERHWAVHVWVLRVGGRLGDLREAGQRLRLVLTPLGHMTGRLPVGKPDGSTVSAFGSLPVSPDLQTLLIDEKN